MTRLDECRKTVETTPFGDVEVFTRDENGCREEFVNLGVHWEYRRFMDGGLMKGLGKSPEEAYVCMEAVYSPDESDSM